MKAMLGSQYGYMVNGKWEIGVPSPLTKKVPFYCENINESNETIHIKRTTSASPTLTIEYSTDKTNWNTLGQTSSELTYTLTPGSKVYLRCSANNWAQWSATFFNYIYGCSKVGGNILSLLYGSSFDGQDLFPETAGAYCFCGLFRNTNNYDNNILKSASELILPKDVKPQCYYNMYYRCKTLTDTPVLPATTMVQECYRNMFGGCTNLTKAPYLPAETLVTYCYDSMFSGCSKLNEIRCNAIDTSASSCLNNWVQNVPSSGGTFYKNANKTDWPTGDAGIPTNWTVVDL